jgi:hypothetical protein
MKRGERNRLAKLESELSQCEADRPHPGAADLDALPLAVLLEMLAAMEKVNPTNPNLPLCERYGRRFTVEELPPHLSPEARAALDAGADTFAAAVKLRARLGLPRAAVRARREGPPGEAYRVNRAAVCDTIPAAGPGGDAAGARARRGRVVDGEQQVVAGRLAHPGPQGSARQSVGEPLCAPAGGPQGAGGRAELVGDAGGAEPGGNGAPAAGEQGTAQ